MISNIHYQKSRYIRKISEHLVMLYGIENGKSKAYIQLKDRLDGFIEAGLLIGIVDNGELQDLINTEHLSAFGMTREQRRTESKLVAKDKKVDWSIYYTPTISRK